MNPILQKDGKAIAHNLNGMYIIFLALICTPIIYLLMNGYAVAGEFWPNTNNRYETFVEPIQSTGRPCPSVEKIYTVSQPISERQLIVHCSNNEAYLVSIYDDRVFVKDWESKSLQPQIPTTNNISSYSDNSDESYGFWFYVGCILLIFFLLKISLNSGDGNVSAEKRQEMLRQSKEIEERIYQYKPDLFILMGKRGGTKIYKTLNGARKARDRK